MTENPALPRAFPQPSLPGLTRQSIRLRRDADDLERSQGEDRMSCWVYILASRPGGTLYIGVTNNLVRRVFEHRESLVPGFTKRYAVKTLVY